MENITVKRKPSQRIKHPFTGGRITATVTRRHKKLVWECMLGTVCAMDPRTNEERYFDYDWEGARDFARLNECYDLRICAPASGPTFVTPGGARRRQHQKVALYGILKD